MTTQPSLPFGSSEAPPEPVSEWRRFRLAKFGVRLFACRLLNHDYLWFSGTEFSKRSETLPVLHNYALTYSLGDYSYWRGPAVPQYEEDLAQILLYATPADAPQVSRTQFTYNALDDLTLRTDAGPRGINTPDLGYRTYLDPVFSAGDRRRPAGFLAYLFTFAGQVPKGVTRLGKKGTAWRVRWSEIGDASAVWNQETVQPHHPVNPLDISGQIVAYEPVLLPPHLLCRRAHIRRDWFIRARSEDGEWHSVHVPRRVRVRIGMEA